MARKRVVKATKLQAPVGTKVEKGVDLVPIRKSSGYGKWYQFFREMEVGDSFEVPVGDVNKVRQAISAHAAQLRMKFTVRSMPGGGYRCWRLE